MRCWRLAPVAVAGLLLAACAPSNVTSPPPFDPAQYPPIRLAVGSVDVSSVASYPTSMGFIARRRSELLGGVAQDVGQPADCHRAHREGERRIGADQAHGQGQQAAGRGDAVGNASKHRGDGSGGA